MPRASTDYLEKKKKIVAVEVGVRSGVHARELLDRLDIQKLYLVDDYRSYAETTADGQTLFWTPKLQEAFCSEAFARLSPDPRAVFIHRPAEEACRLFPDGFFDFIYLDCDHRYEAMRDDLRRWHWKLRPGGILAGHDHSPFFPGVAQAVEEFAAEKNLKLRVFEDSDWLFEPEGEPKKKTAVLTIAMGDHRKIHEWTAESKRKYAARIGADFVVIDRPGIAKTTPHWEKFQIFDLLEKYERILYLDADTIVREDCPDLFQLVPEDHIGLFNEAPFTDRSKELMIDICRQYGVFLDGWNGKYYNTGVMVISRAHRDLFKKPEKEVSSFYEQSYLNMILAGAKPKIHELTHHFNRMTCMDRFLGEDRHASYIVHYAGYPQLDRVLGLIPLDLRRWRNDHPTYKYGRHIYVSVSGGAGDQICAEPAIRFMRRMYPEDEFWVATHYPRLFKHLEKQRVIVCEHGKANLRPDTPYYLAESLPGPDTLQWAIVSHLLCHSVDYCSIALLKRTLPAEDRTIRFDLLPEDFDGLAEKTGLSKKALKRIIVIHPGRHWNSKTFPKEWWQKVIDAALGAGHKVVLIGKDEPGDPPDFKAGARGTVDVSPNGALDLRNKLSLGELGALLSLAKTLISNDSFPVHLAGAFDNRIILIPSCKHPDHVLPIRRGSTGYKTTALYKKLIIDEIESRPTQVYPTSAEVEKIDWDKYLPDPEEVAAAL